MSVVNKSNIRRVRRVRIKWEKDPEQEEGKWTVIKETIIPRMAIPASTEIKSDVPLEKISGLWFEATDEDNTVFYKGKIPEPRLNEVELFDEDGSIYRRKADRTEFIFEVLIPDLPNVSKINLFKTKPQLKKEKRKLSRYKLKRICPCVHPPS